MKKIPTDTFQFRVVKKDGKKVIELMSRQFYQHFLNTKTKPGDVGTMMLTLKKPTRSEQQLRFYAVIVGLIAEHTGHTWEELHDALMIIKFGTTKIKVGKDVVHVRKSVSDKARMGKIEMMELIEFALEKASELEINIPTREELGYLPK